MKRVKNKKLPLILSLCLLMPAPSFAQSYSVDERIPEFYQNFAEAKIAGGQTMIDFYQKHYSDDVSVVMHLTNEFPSTEEGKDKDIRESKVEYGKQDMIQESHLFAKMMDYKKYDYDIFDVNSLGNKVTVKFKRTGNILMTREGIKEPFKLKEESTCEEKLLLDKDTIKIIESECTINVKIDRRA